MKVIDLLNKIANGEEVPVYFKVNNIRFKYEDEHQLYNDLCEDWIYLNDEVIIDEEEIIEEDKKIEKLKWNEKSSYNQEGDTKKVQKILLSRSEQLKSSINEIIDYLEEKE